MANSELTVAEYGPANAPNRLCCAVVVYFSDGTLTQASGTLVQLGGARPLVDGIRSKKALLLPAEVMAKGQGKTRHVERFMICGADLDNQIRVLWHISTEDGWIVQGEHFVVCDEYKPNAPYRKEANWAAIEVAATWQSKPVTLANGQRGTHALGGPNGLFTFPVVDPQIPARVPVLYKILGFPAAHLEGTTGQAEWDKMVGGDPTSLLLKRQRSFCHAARVTSWDEADKVMRALPSGKGDGLPPEEKQYEPQDPSKFMWLLRRAARAMARNRDPLKGEGCKPAFQHRRQVSVGKDLLVGSTSNMPPGNLPGEGWKGGPWVNTESVGTVLGMHIGTTSSNPKVLYFAGSMKASWIKHATCQLSWIAHIYNTNRLRRYD